MPTTTPDAGRASRASRASRADALQNRGRLLIAARDVFVERGPRVALDEIARRAGCGIATLYRRFPDRHALMRAVVLDALEQTVEQARRAADEEPDAFAALIRYMHAALDIRAAAVIPALLGALPADDEELARARERGGRNVEYLIDAAHRAGTLRPDVTFGDIGTLIARLSRPLPGTFTREQNDALAHRHVDLLVGALRSDAAHGELSGPALTRADLRRLPPANTEATDSAS
jgi:AcrR family transcriptional regulator